MERKEGFNYVACLSLIAVASFVVFGILNNTGSANLAMVRIFEPDEAAVLPVIQSMVTPKENLDSFLRGFIFYSYYFYGFPFFGLSGLVTLPFQWNGQLFNTQALMLALRQLVSVLPMFAGLLILVYLQDGFKSYRSIVLFLFLMIVPATLHNGLWFHPDGLVILLSTLILYFLVKDNRSLGKYFFISAALCGILIATKVVGAFFFLAVGMVVTWALVEKKVTWKKAVLSSVAYILILALFFVLANPFLLSGWARTEYLNIAKRQSNLLSMGYGVIYEKGLKNALPTLRHYYGEILFLVITLIISVAGLFNEKRRFLTALILSWFLPLTVYVFFFSHFKYQYWLPVALPIFSTWVVFLPDNRSWVETKLPVKVATALLIAILAIQSFLFLRQDFKTISEHLVREENNTSIGFYERVSQVLGPALDDPLTVYFDYRLYLPDDNNWQKETSFELLTYEYIQEGDFDLLFIKQQRIRDYLQEGLTGVDPDEFARSQIFYHDADNGTIKGYTLVYRDNIGLVFEQKP